MRHGLSFFMKAVAASVVMALPAISFGYTSSKYVFPEVGGKFYKAVPETGKQQIFYTWVNPRSAPSEPRQVWQLLPVDNHIRFSILLPPGVSIATAYANSYFFTDQHFGVTTKNIPYCPRPSARPAAPPYCSEPGVESSSEYLYLNDLPIFRALNNFVYPTSGGTGVINDKARYVYLHLYNGFEQSFEFGQMDFSMVIDDPKMYMDWLRKRPWSSVYDGTPGQSNDGVDGSPPEGCTVNCGPTPFTFNPKPTATPGSEVISDSVTLAGQGGTWTISVGTNAQYSLNGGAFTSSGGQAKAGDTIRLKVTAPTGPGTSLTATVTIGTTTANFSVTSVAQTLTCSTLSGVAKSIYTGRTNQLLGDRLRLQEESGGSIKGQITGSLSSGVMFAANSSIGLRSDEGGVPKPTADISIGTSAKSQVAFTLPADTNDTLRGYLELGSDAAPITLDTTSATTVGEVSVTFAGGASCAPKLAQLKDATTYANVPSASLVSLAPGGAAVALPEISIAEADKGALDLTGNKTLAIKLPTGVTFDTSVVPTVQVLKAGALAGDVQVASQFGGNTDLKLTLGANWNSATDGPYTIVVKGLKAQADSNTTAADFKVMVGGSKQVGGTALTDADFGSNEGAKATKRDIKLGTIGAGVTPWIPPASVQVADPKQAQIKALKLTPASADKGKAGSLFVAATVGNQLFFLTSGSGWMLYTRLLECFASGGPGCDGAKIALQSQANLDTLTFDVLANPLDISGLKPLRIFAGYGMGSDSNNPMPVDGQGSAAFANMLRNQTYTTIYSQ
ncbi:hypothetical protein [Parachitinimonas caeni]|uniref:Uncharacterized protein n=1 Tax=Parachitinimonas caeni TaxID=3031301 RepID=A0ABT7DRV0_9NEIS|nr:hypothetical protein [Parachitinimonas caeni]MDK2122795.1 hypothetical protein [Parachitinimonas caeni]